MAWPSFAHQPHRSRSFHSIPFDEIDAAMTRLNIQKIGCYHGFLQHELYGGEIVDPPPNYLHRTTPGKMYGLVQIDAPEQPGHLALQVHCCLFGQIFSFRVKLDLRSDTTTKYATVDLYAKHE
jgi:hypothetical protein